MVIVGSTTNYLKALFLTNALMTIYVVKDGRIIPIIRVIGEFLMRSQRNSQVFKDTNQIVTSRFANVDSIAAIARITVKKVRTYTMRDSILKHQKIS